MSSLKQEGFFLPENIEITDFFKNDPFIQPLPPYLGPIFMFQM